MLLPRVRLTLTQVINISAQDRFEGFATLEGFATSEGVATVTGMSRLRATKCKALRFFRMSLP